LDLTIDYEDSLIFGWFLGVSLVALITIRQGLVLVNTDSLHGINEDELNIKDIETVTFKKEMSPILTQLYTIN